MALVVFKRGSKTLVETAVDYAAMVAKYPGKILRHIATK